MAASTSTPSAYKDLRFKDTLEDLSSRFIVNLPAEELASIERICFQVEQAHWFYEDFLRPLNPSLPSLSLRKFTLQLLITASHTVPLIRRYISKQGNANDYQELEEAFEEFLRYKHRVPVCGAVMLNEQCDKCVLVRAWKGNSWGFPKGKINQSEPERDCAIREVYEETGYDCSALLPPDSKDYMDLTMRGHKIRIYIVPGVPEDTVFETLTRKEISKIDWFKLSELPTWKSAKSNSSSAAPGGKFYLISPFVERLKHWLSQHRPHTKSIRPSAVSVPMVEPTTADLKAALGLGFTSPLESKEHLDPERHPTAPPPVADEQRSRALLEILRGAAEPALSAEPARLEGAYQNGAWERGYEPDERERGAASLLAALHAGAGRAQNVAAAAAPVDQQAASLSAMLSIPAPQQPPPPPPSQHQHIHPPNANSAALLDLLNAPSSLESTSSTPWGPPASFPSPCPRRQEQSQSQTLLSMLNGSNAKVARNSVSAPNAPDASQKQTRSLLSMLNGVGAPGNLTASASSAHVQRAQTQDQEPPHGHSQGGQSLSSVINAPTGTISPAECHQQPSPERVLPQAVQVSQSSGRSTMAPPITSPGGSVLTEEERTRKRDALLATMMSGASLNGPSPGGRTYDTTASLSPSLRQSLLPSQSQKISIATAIPAIPQQPSPTLVPSPEREKNRSQRIREAQERDRAMGFRFPPTHSSSQEGYGHGYDQSGEEAHERDSQAQAADSSARSLLSLLDRSSDATSMTQQATSTTPSTAFAPFGSLHPPSHPAGTQYQSAGPATLQAQTQAGSLLSLLNASQAPSPSVDAAQSSALRDSQSPARPPTGNAAMLLSMLNSKSSPAQMHPPPQQAHSYDRPHDNLYASAQPHAPVYASPSYVHQSPLEPYHHPPPQQQQPYQQQPYFQSHQAPAPIDPHARNLLAQLQGPGTQGSQQRLGVVPM